MILLKNKSCLFLVLFLTVYSTLSYGQQKAGNIPRSYNEVITAKAVTHKGLFTTHLIDNHWYFEIPDSLIGRNFLLSARISTTGAGAGQDDSDIGTQVVYLEKGPDNMLFMRTIVVANLVSKKNQSIAKAVAKSNQDPIIASFEIRTYSNRSSIIDVTDFFKSENQAISIRNILKARYGLLSVDQQRSYLKNIETFPTAINIKSVKTFNANPPAHIHGGTEIASTFGSVTIEINDNLLLLPKEPMRKRLYDPRVGYLTSNYTTYGDDFQKEEKTRVIRRWRLEPQKEDLEKWYHGQVVEPANPIVIYIDPATPKQWRSFIIAGINDWQPAFLQAGFKNAIMGKEWPEQDSTMNLNDTRLSVLHYYANPDEQCSGRTIFDPRTGEILSAQIEFNSGIMKILHKEYTIQAGATDPRARKMQFDNELMGQLIRFIVEHEVGHSLGLGHNFGASYATPVDSLRSEHFLEKNGHTASIMDYARFNYVAQPKDHIQPQFLFPRVGDYDKWAIFWGYKHIPNTKDEYEDRKILSQWIADSVTLKPRLWFGNDGYNDSDSQNAGYDSRVQIEDLGNDNMKANEYGIKNLQRILPNLLLWCQENGHFNENLKEMYSALLQQFNDYINQVIKNVGALQETAANKSELEYTYLPNTKSKAIEAMAFLNKHLFGETPRWLVNKAILEKFSDPDVLQGLSKIQSNALSNLLSVGRLYRLETSFHRYGATVYSAENLLTDSKKIIWHELDYGGPIDEYKRDLQKNYIDILGNILKPGERISRLSETINMTDLFDLVHKNLIKLRNQIMSAISKQKDVTTKTHLKICVERINHALNQ